MPVRLVVVGGEDGSGRLPGPPAPSAAGWAEEPQTLRALAIALERIVGEAPDPYAAGWTPELGGWSERYNRAGEILAEVANMDARLLRFLAGPPHDDDGPRPAGTGLLVLAAIKVERGRSES